MMLQANSWITHSSAIKSRCLTWSVLKFLNTLCYLPLHIVRALPAAIHLLPFLADYVGKDFKHLLDSYSIPPQLKSSNGFCSSRTSWARTLFIWGRLYPFLAPHYSHFSHLSVCFIHEKAKHIMQLQGTDFELQVRCIHLFCICKHSEGSWKRFLCPSRQ